MPTDSYHHSGFTYRIKHRESDPLTYLKTSTQFNTAKQKKTTQEEYIHDWQHKVSQLKKLTYFHKIKSDYKLAPYLSSIKDYRQRKLLMNCCISEHSLSVETGRDKESSDCAHTALTEP
ncbi:Urease accessory protein UreG [Labeo rohita]|uniref:Urease accessory protein UreG n=1 Tax=Labeo rohita TaxID=84645 RepID=A0ABQ8MQZ6_LABRO|nr:Urease accessory protein UreG [Labeo rohita]